MTEPSDPAELEQTLVDGVVTAPLELDVITATGADAEDYLQGQLSQNVSTLAVGQTRWTLLLQPQGKVDAWMRLHRPAPEVLWLMVDAGFGDHALARLERFKLRVNVALDLDRRPALALRGTAAEQAAQLFVAAGDVVVDAGWGTIPGVDVLPSAERERPDPAVLDGSAFQAVPTDATGLDLIRILQGRPAMGRELTESTIPAAAAVVDASVDFTKGCYVGQELVARIDSRGSNTPTRLVRITTDSDHRLALDSEITVDGSEGGRVTSTALSPQGGSVGLAYVRRNVEVPGLATVSAADGDVVTVKLEPLNER